MDQRVSNSFRVSEFQKFTFGELASLGSEVSKSSKVQVVQRVSKVSGVIARRHSLSRFFGNETPKVSVIYKLLLYNCLTGLNCYLLSQSPHLHPTSPHRPISLRPIALSPSLRVSQSPCLPVSMSPSLRVSQSPCLPVSMSPSLHVSQSPCLPITPTPQHKKSTNLS